MNNSAKIVLDDFFKILQIEAPNSHILEQLTNLQLLSKDFESRYILHNVDKVYTITNIVEDVPNKILVFVEAKDNSPYRIELIKSSKWQINSFLCQCQGCFGEDTTCGVCGGGGWGVL